MNYLAKPNISYVLVCRFFDTPCTSHWDVLVHILIYLKTQKCFNKEITIIRIIETHILKIMQGVDFTSWQEIN